MPPEPMDFAGLIQKLDGEWWTFADSFQVSSETGRWGPASIAMPRCALSDVGEEIWAKRITGEIAPEYEFGAIETVAAIGLSCA
jgi:hypothetical protein